MIKSARRIVGTLTASALLAAGAAALLPGAAQAALINTDMCDGSALSQPFTPWADFAQYKLAPGGDFESGLAGWSLNGGAGATSGSESFGVTGTVGSTSLALPSGSSASSPATCVDAAYPTFRLFTRSDTPGTVLSVTASYGSAIGPVTIPVGTVTPGASWQLSPLMVTGSAVGGAMNGGTANVTLNFASSGGTAQVDDVYIDPTGRCC